MSIKSLVIRRIGETEEMGLSSSQGRLLMLTSRLSDIELQQMLISQRQNALAVSSQKAAEEYNNALTNCKIVIKMPNENEKVGYTKEDLSYNNMTELGYLATDGTGAVYLKRTYRHRYHPPLRRFCRP